MGCWKRTVRRETSGGKDVVDEVLAGEDAACDGNAVVKGAVLLEAAPDVVVIDGVMDDWDGDTAESGDKGEDGDVGSLETVGELFSTVVVRRVSVGTLTHRLLVFKTPRIRRNSIHASR
jgi:hypothetical protein